MYGLGSLVKSITKPIKKVVSGVKDFAKSDIGKMALTAGALYGLGGGTFFGRGLPGLARTGEFSFSNIMPNLLGTSVAGSGVANQGLLAKIGLTEGYGGGLNTGNLFKAAAITIPSVLAAAGVEDEQEIAELKQDKSALTAALERGYRNLNPGVSDEEVASFVRTYSAEGGRIGFNEGSYNPGARYQFLIDKFNSGEKLTDDEVRELEALEMSYADESKEMASGGRVKFAMGDSAEQNAIQASGIMGLPLNENPAGITELDLRETGGFIPPVGVKEKADDIPAMLSNNEFVFTADAVRGMGGGDVDKGAERMYAMMKTLENGGRV
jgi:hypothetical protein